MKKFREWLMMSLVILFLGTSACSSGEEEPVVPEFPTTQTFNVSANSEKTLSFTANMNWRLSSNKTWCTLAISTMEGQNISGEAGSQSVKIMVNDEGQDFVEAIATITLSMGGENQVIAEVVRAAKAYELKIYDSEGNEINQLAIGSDGSFYFKVEANFEFAAAEFPKWTNVEMNQDETNVGIQTGIISVKDDAVKYTQEPSDDNVLKFVNQLGTASFKIPVTYTGMAPDMITFNPGNRWGVSVSVDGKTYKNQSLEGNTQEDTPAPYNFTISALNDEYHFVYYGYNSMFGWTMYQIGATDSEQPWFTVTDDKKGNISVMFAENTDVERKGYILAFPKAIYDNISVDIDSQILDQSTDIWELKTEFEKYVVAEFIQESEKEDENVGFYVINSKTYQEIINTKVTDPNIIEVVNGNCLYFDDNIYSINVEPGTPILIYPQLSESLWTCDMSAMVEGDKNPVIEPYYDEVFKVGQQDRKSVV